MKTATFHILLPELSSAERLAWRGIRSVRSSLLRGITVSDLSLLEKLIPTKLSRWAFLAMLSTPAPGYFFAKALVQLVPTADAWHKGLLWIAITLLFLFACACLVIFDLALLHKNKKYRVIWHHKSS